MKMNNKNKLLAVTGVFLLLVMSLPGIGWAQESGSSWDQLSPSEQKVLKPFAGKWDQLPPDKRSRLKKGANRWGQLTPQQRQNMKQRMKTWQGMTPKKR